MNMLRTYGPQASVLLSMRCPLLERLCLIERKGHFYCHAFYLLVNPSSVMHLFAVETKEGEEPALPRQKPEAHYLSPYTGATREEQLAEVLQKWDATHERSPGWGLRNWLLPHESVAVVSFDGMKPQMVTGHDMRLMPFLGTLNERFEQHRDTLRRLAADEPQQMSIKHHDYEMFWELFSKNYRKRLSTFYEFCRDS